MGGAINRGVLGGGVRGACWCLWFSCVVDEVKGTFSRTGFFCLDGDGKMGKLSDSESDEGASSRYAEDVTRLGATNQIIRPDK